MVDFTADLLGELGLVTSSPGFGSILHFLEVSENLARGIKCRI